MYLQLILTALLLIITGVFTVVTTMCLLRLGAKTVTDVLSVQAGYQRYRRLKIENDNLQVVPDLIRVAMERGLNVEFKGVKVSDWKSNMHSLSSERCLAVDGPQGDKHRDLPGLVTYEEIKDQIPEGHNLVGIGPDGVITKHDRFIGACTWICGLSGTGKTTTTVIRVKEKQSCGHRFLGYDPHWFKDDSLTNALKGFADDFILPMARSTFEAIKVFRMFLDEFNNRKAGIVSKPFQKWTLVVDEVNAINDAKEKEEKEVLELLKTIVRICGQEARNFEMAGIFCSQQATGLYWIRNVALLIIIHKLLMENQQRIATNMDDKKFFAEMRLWPKGRTYVYGAGLEQGEGCMVMQQPYIESIPDGNWVFDEMPSLPTQQDTNKDLLQSAVQKVMREGRPISARELAKELPYGKTKVAELMKEHGL
jgi:hypothetical protein